MLHLSDGTLRRLLDDPSAPAADREHLAGCTQCVARQGSLAERAAAAARALEVLSSAHRDLGSAAAVVRARALAEAGGLPAQRQLPRYALPAGAVAAIAVLALGIAFTPLRTVAGNFLAIFEPHQFVAVPVTRADLAQLRALPALETYGMVRGGEQPQHAQVDSARSAARLARIPVKVPAYIPVSARGRATFEVVAQTTASFTFSAAKARTAAAREHTTIPPLPAGLDGSTLQASIGPVVMSLYGTQSLPVPFKHHRLRHFMPALTVVQAPAPRVWSTGASVAEIEQFLLAQPGMPPRLAAEIRAIGDPATTIPIPVPIERDYATRVNVQGTQGLAIGDNTGLGAGVLWQQNGMIYAVAGALPASEIQAVANSLR